MLDEIDEQIIEYLKRGFIQKEIARMIFVSESTVHNRIKKMEESGIKLERNKRLDEIDYMIIDFLKDGIKQNDIAKRLNITQYSVFSRIKKIQEFGYDIDKLKYKTLDRKILDSVKDGLTYDEIAKTLGVDRGVVEYRIICMSKKGIETTKRGNIIPILERQKMKEDREKIESLSDIDKRILMYLDEGLSILEITRITNAPRQLISIEIRKMKENGIRLPSYDKSREVFILLREGLSYKEIAKILNASTKTINTIVRNKIEEETKLSKKVIDLNNISREKMIESLYSLKNTKNATPEQIKILADCFGIDLENELSEKEI